MFCNMEKAWLSQHKIPFTERNIVEDESALAEPSALMSSLLQPPS